MKDGLYQVTYKGICAGFLIKDRKLMKCAPILRRNFDFWKTIEKRIGD
jgi:hypothetical protein